MQERYLRLLAAAPVSVTAIREPTDAWQRDVVDSLSALPLVVVPPGSLVDVGSGGGSPGIPLAIELGCPVTLVEATGTKARFLEGVMRDLGLPGDVVAQRSEQFARAGGRDAFDLAVARALAPPPIAAELCLPLVRPGGRLILWTGGFDASLIEPVAAALGGAIAGVEQTAPGRELVVIEKLHPTPERFPRRPGMARKRPLVSLPSDA